MRRKARDQPLCGEIRLPERNDAARH